MLSRSFIKSNQIFFKINIIIPEVDVTLKLILLKMNVHCLSIDVYFFIKVVKIIFYCDFSVYKFWAQNKTFIYLGTAIHNLKFFQKWIFLKKCINKYRLSHFCSFYL